MTDIDFYDGAYSPPVSPRLTPNKHKQRITNPIYVKKTIYGSRIIKQLNNYQSSFIIKRKQYK